MDLKKYFFAKSLIKLWYLMPINLMGYYGISMKKLKGIIFIFFINLLTYSCQELGKVELGKTATENVSNSSFQGIDQITQVTDSTATIEWTHLDGIVAYEIYNTTNGVNFVTTVFAPTSSYQLSNLSNNTKYQFKVRAKNANGELDGNLKNVDFTTKLAPNAPSELTLLSPSNSTGFDYTPTIKILGVKAGDLIKLFSDSSCTNLVGSETATSTSVEITTSELSVGNFTFYATATNENSNVSECSSNSLNYTLVNCPTGYIKVPGNSSLGVDDFCVMKFEAKEDGNSDPVSIAAGAPWGSISIVDAKLKCQGLGEGFDLMSNPEWMTVTHNIESVASNWSDSIIGSGKLYRGHSDNDPAGPIEISDETNPYSDTGNNASQALGSGLEQRRTHYLSNDEVIWDISGNIFELVDWTLGGDLSSGPTTCADNGWEQFPDVNCDALSSADYMPANPAGISASIYNSNFFLGRFRGNANGYARRGGTYQSQASAGIFLVDLGFMVDQKSGGVGFRCVYRP